MKKFFVASVVLTGALMAVRADAYSPITPGDVVVYQVGDGSVTLTSSNAPVFLDEYTPTGTLVQQIAMPNAASGPDAALTSSGNSTAEGLLTLEADGQNIVVTGYGAAPNTVNGVATTTSVAVPRVVGLVGVSTPNIDTTTVLNNVASGGSIRSAASDAGNNIWVAGSVGGLVYTTLGASTATANIAGGNGGPVNMRQVNIINGQLMVGDQSGSAFRLANVGSGLPTTVGQNMANLPGTTGGNPTSTYAFVQLHLAGGPAGLNTMYVADDVNAAVATAPSVIEKWSLVSGTWVLTGNIAAPVPRGVAAEIDPNTGNVDLFFTDGTTQAGTITNLNLLVDASGYNGTLSGTPTVIATAGNNEVFRGIVVTPVPEPSTVMLVGAGLMGLLAMRRRRS